MDWKGFGRKQQWPNLGNAHLIGLDGLCENHKNVSHVFHLRFEPSASRMMQAWSFVLRHPTQLEGNRMKEGGRFVFHHFPLFLENVEANFKASPYHLPGLLNFFFFCFSTPVVFNLFYSRTPGCHFSSTLYPQMLLVYN
jgi:hypothetical protein